MTEEDKLCQALIHCLHQRDFELQSAVDGYLQGNQDSKWSRYSGSRIRQRYIGFQDRIHQLIKLTTFRRTKSGEKEIKPEIMGLDLEGSHSLFKMTYDGLDLKAEDSHRLELIDAQDGSLQAKMLFALFRDLPAEKIRAPEFVISIVNSEVIDAGGVLKAVMSSFSQTIGESEGVVINGLVGLSSKEIFFSPQGRNEAEKKEDATTFRTFGRLIAFCLLHKVQIPKISLVVFKLLLDQTVDFEDLASLYPDYFKSIRRMCMMEEKELADLGLCFLAPHPSLHTDVELQSGGSNVSVHSKNCVSFMKLMSQFYLGTNLPWNQLALGVQDIFPLKCLEMFSPEMLQLAVCGSEDFDMHDLLTNAVFKMDSGQREMLCSTLLTFDTEERSLFLVFVTGSSSVPGVGFKLMDPPITFVTDVRHQDAHFPESHTCFNLLCIPQYSNDDIMKSKIIQAVRNTKVAEFSMQ
eukprot:TRINITY_DN49383_c0_g3_i3.p1 TRINITY_DN49383_c0_g3~~TRINITY_DN49383_c0_g3_i3.p1  ORF type:complete len:494 (-),score=120.63 TRINITY_DN49383_c0_g3_i3:11-1402(-)